MRSRKWFAAVVGGLTVAACAQIILTGCHHVLTPQQAEGEHLYDTRCAHCHEDNDLGLKKVPPNLHGVFNRDELPSGAPATDAEVEKVVLAGRGLMPSFAGRFGNEQIAALIAYIHTGMRDAKTE